MFGVAWGLVPDCDLGSEENCSVCTCTDSFIRTEPCTFT